MTDYPRITAQAQPATALVVTELFDSEAELLAGELRALYIAKQQIEAVDFYSKHANQPRTIG